MAATQWETCSADALLREFFAQDDLSRLAEGAGALLGCPLLVLDDTFHVAAHHLPLGFSDAVFQASVRSGEITYEAGAIISRSPALSAGAADCVKLATSVPPPLCTARQCRCAAGVPDLRRHGRASGKNPGADMEYRGANSVQAAFRRGQPAG